jgi:peptide/nickel transport system permease protein
MWKYLVSRSIQILVTLFIFFFLTYLIMDAQPGDITLQYVNPRFTEEQRQALRHRLGLDRPVTVRFFQWVDNVLHGELGDSFVENRPVIDIIKERAPRTIFLFLTASIITFVVGYFLGRILAWKRGTSLEYGITLFGAVMFSIFTPWFALIMVWLFSYTLKWFPLGKFLDPKIWLSLPKDSPIDANFIFNGMLLTATIVVFLVLGLYLISRRMNPNHANRIFSAGSLMAVGGGVIAWVLYPYGYLAADILRHLVLPVLTLTLINFAGTMLLTRTTMLETLREDYITAARAKGLTENEVRDKHAARNAMLPVFTSFVINLPFILAGGIITETIFSWPGMGLTLLEAATSTDIPMIMGAWLFIGTISLFAHLVADIAYVFLDPRIRFA